MTAFNGRRVIPTQHGTVFGSTLAAGATTTVAVTFPIAYGVAPSVQLTGFATTGAARMNVALATNPTATGFTATVTNVTGTPGNVAFAWEAKP